MKSNFSKELPIGNIQISKIEAALAEKIKPNRLQTIYFNWRNFWLAISNPLDYKIRGKYLKWRMNWLVVKLNFLDMIKSIYQTWSFIFQSEKSFMNEIIVGHLLLKILYWTSDNISNNLAAMSKVSDLQIYFI